MLGIKRAFEKHLGKQAIEKLVVQGTSAPLVDRHMERKSCAYSRGGPAHW